MNTINVVLTVSMMLQVKHFVADFLLQPPYMWKNKGTYGHPGGIWHAGFHGLLTVLILFACISPWRAIVIAAVEIIAHYHIDWAKMRLNAYAGWKCNEHPQFWLLLGIDQLMHQLCYIIILALVATATQ